MLLQIFNRREVRITGFCPSPQEDSGVNKFWKPLVFEKLFYLPKIAIWNTSLEMTTLIFTCWCMRWRNPCLSQNREHHSKRFSGSIGNDFIPHINYWNSMGHFKTLPTFVMDGVPYGNFNPQAYEKHSVKLYTQESARNLSLSFSLCGYQAPEDDFFSVHIRIAGDWTGEVKILLVSSLAPALPSSSVTRNVILGADQTISFPESSGLLVSVWEPGETLG